MAECHLITNKHTTEGIAPKPFDYTAILETMQRIVAEVNLENVPAVFEMNCATRPAFLTALGQCGAGSAPASAGNIEYGVLIEFVDYLPSGWIQAKNSAGKVVGIYLLQDGVFRKLVTQPFITRMP